MNKIKRRLSKTSGIYEQAQGLCHNTDCQSIFKFDITMFGIEYRKGKLLSLQLRCDFCQALKLSLDFDEL